MYKIQSSVADVSGSQGAGQKGKNVYGNSGENRQNNGAANGINDHHRPNAKMKDVNMGYNNKYGQDIGGEIDLI